MKLHSESHITILALFLTGRAPSCQLGWCPPHLALLRHWMVVSQSYLKRGGVFYTVTLHSDKVWEPLDRWWFSYWHQVLIPNVCVCICVASDPKQRGVYFCVHFHNKRHFEYIGILSFDTPILCFLARGGFTTQGALCTTQFWGSSPEAKSIENNCNILIN